MRGAEVVRAAVDGGRGVLITPNHPGHADAYAMFEAADAAGRPFYFMSAWQVFAMQGAIGRWLLTRHGCFSVDREGADKEAFRTAVEVVRERREPLVVFPEGEVYHQNDRVTPFRDGAAAIALSAARKAARPIVAIPCAIKYAYLEDPTPALVELMGRLEAKVLWRPRPDLPLAQRVYRFAEGLLALKEIEYLGETLQGTIAARRLVLADHILRGIEERYGVRGKGERSDGASVQRGSANAGRDGVGRSEDAVRQTHDLSTSAGAMLPVRVKEARAACLKRLAEMEEGRGGGEGSESAPTPAPPPQSRGRGSEDAVRQAHGLETSVQRLGGDAERGGSGETSDRAQVAADLDDLFLVVQAFSYPGDYVDERPSVERLAETLDKFEEDVLGAATATVRAPRRAVVQFGDAVEVGGGEGGSARDQSRPHPDPPPPFDSAHDRPSRGREHSGEGDGGERKKMTAGELTAILEGRVQELLDGIG